MVVHPSLTQKPTPPPRPNMQPCIHDRVKATLQRELHAVHPPSLTQMTASRPRSNVSQCGPPPLSLAHASMHTAYPPTSPHSRQDVTPPTHSPTSCSSCTLHSPHTLCTHSQTLTMLSHGHSPAHLHISHAYPPYPMASSSNAPKKRKGKGKALVDDDSDAFDPTKFKSPFHQNFFNTYVASKAIIQDATFDLQDVRYPQIIQQIDLRGLKRLNKPKKKINQSIIREFYSNARVDPDTESGPRFLTFVRGVLMNFSYERVKEIMKFKGPLNTEMSYKTRMIPVNHDPDAIIRDLCVEEAVWELGAHNKPRILRRTDLIPIAKGQEVRVEKLIADSMMKVINKLHFPKTPLALPNIIARLCDEMEVPYVASIPIEVVPKAKFITTTVMEGIKNPPQPQFHHEKLAYDAANMPQGYGWGQLQEDMGNILAQQTAYGRRLQDIEARQKEIWVEQQQFQQDMNQNLAPIAPAKIPRMIKENFQAARPLFHGMLRPGPSKGSSSALDQQAPPAANIPREPNADNN
ncbi:hypothetical protein PIB30_046006 [Stylosanthes scabra]|uniref:Putative plant transposon protein domain-containing protein n=1 Tax=Stylosanthes scabra TaxID=79078 RepID=A0ABU6VHS4_9FABA|nr:hypothetical protein [Stylosanthes scabra]